MQARHGHTPFPPRVPFTPGYASVGVIDALGDGVIQSLAGSSASQVAVRSWLLPALPLGTAAATALAFWLHSTLGFALAALSFWGVFVPGQAWRQLAVGSAIVSVLGIAAFSGIWPGSPNRPRSVLNTSVALAMNALDFGTQLWLHWPPQAMLGK